MADFAKWDRVFISEMHQWAIPALRLALGIVFLWFGLLKVFGASPVAELVAGAYWFFPQKEFFLILGIWETAIGLGLIFKIALRATLALLWLQMLGTLVAPLLSPAMFFSDGNPLLLTTEGEFVIKNLVLIAAGLVIGGHEVKPRELKYQRSNTLKQRI